MQQKGLLVAYIYKAHTKSHSSEIRLSHAQVEGAMMQLYNV